MNSRMRAEALSLGLETFRYGGNWQMDRLCEYEVDLLISMA